MDLEVMEILKAVPKDKAKELIKLAAKEENAAGIVKIANDNGITLTEEQAQAVLKAFSEKLEVAGDDLDKVSGGGSCGGC